MKKDLELFEELKCIMVLYTLLSEQVCEKYNITQTELDVMAFLSNHPELNTASDIVNIRRLPKANVSQAVDTLMQKQYLERRTDENDRRKIHLTITSSAKATVKAIKEMQKKWQGIRFSGFSEAEKNAYHNVVYRMYENSMNEIERINVEGKNRK